MLLGIKKKDKILINPTDYKIKFDDELILISDNPKSSQYIQMYQNIKNV